MPFDIELAQSIRVALSSEPSVEERKMFGGLAFLIGGHMTVAASSKGGLMIRADPAAAADLVATTKAEYVVMRGKQMHGWLHLNAADVESEHELASWVNHAVSHLNHTTVGSGAAASLDALRRSRPAL
jgi:TfoX/Sxy family transcriptional regulator of competence genes